MTVTPKPKLDEYRSTDQIAISRRNRAATVTAGSLLLALGVVLAGANLRPAVTSLAAVLGEVRESLGLSAIWVSVITAVPTLCFGVAALGAPLISRRFGAMRVVGFGLAAITLGLAVRVLYGPAVLVVCTVVACSAIALCNVLIPVVVKDYFPNRVGLLMGLYSAALSGGGALAAAFTAPLERAVGGWRTAVGIWALLGGLALVVWVAAWWRERSPARRVAELAVLDAETKRPHSLLRSPLAWAVTGYFGLQGLIAYTWMGWLPEILRDVAGVAPTTAGVMLAVVMVIGVPAGMVVPPLITRRTSQSGWAVGMTLFGAAGVLGLLLAPTAAPWLWVLLLGIGLGSAFPLALTLITLRAKSSADTAALSAMTQSLGYLIAAVGPFGVGLLHGSTLSWTASLVLVLVVLAAQAVIGVFAGRPRYV